MLLTSWEFSPEKLLVRWLGIKKKKNPYLISSVHDQMLKKKTIFVVVKKGTDWAVTEESCELEGVSGTGQDCSLGPC